MDPARNPFAPGAGSQPPELVGRSEVLDRAKTALARVQTGKHSRSALLYGLRGVGKTVLLNRIQKMADEAGYQTALLEAPEERKLAELLAPPLRQLLLRIDLKAGAKHKLREALGALQAFASKFEVTIGDVGVGIKPPAGTADSGVLANDLTDLLVAVGEAAKERGTAVALFLDELQYVDWTELADLISSLHRVGQLNLPLLIFGAGLPQLVGFTGQARSYAERLFHFERIGPLTDADAARALSGPIRDEGADIEQTAIKSILRATQGYPYFIQEWGSHSWNHAPASPIRKKDAVAAGKNAIETLDAGFFRVRFDRLTPRERDYLRAMAELGQGPHRSGDIAECLGINVESAAPLRSGLIKKGMIYSPQHGDTAFTVPLFDEYMKRVMADLRTRKR
jgi:AAA ATPase domain